MSFHCFKCNNYLSFHEKNGFVYQCMKASCRCYTEYEIGHYSLHIYMPYDSGGAICWEYRNHTNETIIHNFNDRFVMNGFIPFPKVLNMKLFL